MHGHARPEPARLAPHRGSQVHLDEWVAPDIADERGYLRAGKILEWMDVVGVVAATRHCRMPVVTAAIDGMVLRDPIRVGERVAEHEETLRAFLTYAPADAGKVPAPVTCASDDERAVFEEVEHRLAMQRMLEAE